MVVNFQSWLDPLIIMMALPSALVSIVWMLFVPVVYSILRRKQPRNLDEDDANLSPQPAAVAFSSPHLD